MDASWDDADLLADIQLQASCVAPRKQPASRAAPSKHLGSCVAPGKRPASTPAAGRNKARKSASACSGANFLPATVCETDWRILGKPELLRNLKDGRQYLTVGSDCCGWLTEGQALEQLKIPHLHSFISDILPEVHRLVQANYKVVIAYKNIKDEEHLKAPEVDIYVTGFPCGPFSKCGLNEGLQGLQGEVIFYVLVYIQKRLPVCFILENVDYLASVKHKAAFDFILGQLKDMTLKGSRKLAYDIQVQVLDTKVHGSLPQHRERMYIVGIRRDRKILDFEFPGPIPMKSFHSLRDKDDAVRELPKPSATTRVKNIARVESHLRQNGTNPRDYAIVVDADSGFPGMPHFTFGYCPTITRTRGGARGFYCTDVGGMLSTHELCRLQGCRKKLKWRDISITESQLGQIAGNAMSIPIVGRILVSLLPAAGLTMPLQDVWAMR